MEKMGIDMNSNPATFSALAHLVKLDDWNPSFILRFGASFWNQVLIFIMTISEAARIWKPNARKCSAASRFSLCLCYIYNHITPLAVSRFVSSLITAFTPLAVLHGMTTGRRLCFFVVFFSATDENRDSEGGC